MKNASGAGLSRILEHSKEDTIAMITAFSGEYSNAENQERNKELGNNLVHSGYGYIKIEENYQENGYDEVSKEDSLLVICPKDQNYEMFKEIMIALAKNYEQDAVLIKKPDESSFLYFNDGTSEDVGDWHSISDVDATITAWSGRKGNLFVFGSLQEPFKAINHISAMGRNATRKRILGKENYNELLKKAQLREKNEMNDTFSILYNGETIFSGDLPTVIAQFEFYIQDDLNNLLAGNILESARPEEYEITDGETYLDIKTDTNAFLDIAQINALWNLVDQSIEDIADSVYNKVVMDAKSDAQSSSAGESVESRVYSAITNQSANATDAVVWRVELEASHLFHNNNTEDLYNLVWERLIEIEQERN